MIKTMVMGVGPLIDRIDNELPNLAERQHFRFRLFDHKSFAKYRQDILVTEHTLRQHPENGNADESG
jgi:hypothetical protein